MNKKTILIMAIEIIILWLIIRLANSKYIEMLPACWIYQETGVLCPACGVTRCIIHLLQGNFIQAFFHHIIFFIGILYLLIINLIYIINIDRKQKIGTWLYPKYWYSYIFVILLIIYTIIRNRL